MSKYKSALIVDDQQDQVELVCDYLDFKSIESKGANDFTAFKHLYAELSPDIVILDISMPDHDAFDYISWIAQQKFVSKLLFMSGMGTAVIDVAVVIAQSHGLPIVGQLNKPFTFQNLEALLQ